MVFNLIKFIMAYNFKIESRENPKDLEGAVSRDLKLNYNSN